MAGSNYKALSIFFSNRFLNLLLNYLAYDLCQAGRPIITQVIQFYYWKHISFLPVFGTAPIFRDVVNISNGSARSPARTFKSLGWKLSRSGDLKISNVGNYCYQLRTL